MVNHKKVFDADKWLTNWGKKEKGQIQFQVFFSEASRWWFVYVKIKIGWSDYIWLRGEILLHVLCDVITTHVNRRVLWMNTSTAKRSRLSTNKRPCKTIPCDCDFASSSCFLATSTSCVAKCWKNPRNKTPAISCTDCLKPRASVLTGKSGSFVSS